jgi:hypothetical protein
MSDLGWQAFWKGEPLMVTLQDETGLPIVATAFRSAHKWSQLGRSGTVGEYLYLIA